MTSNIRQSAHDRHANSTRHCAQINGITPPVRYAFLLVLLQAALIGCGDNASNQATGPAQAPPPNVKVAQALTQEVTEWDEYTGRVEAVNSVDIRARVSGYLEKVNFTAGAKVRQGDLLFLIDPKPYKAQLNYALAELERAKTKEELAKNDQARAENLFKAKAISMEE